MTTGTGLVDLRSDTVTRPTQAMRRAMSRAKVGDDVFREDPTVRLLEERAAEVAGTQAALFVPSGTMANLIAVMVHVPRGGEVIADDAAHVVINEAGGAATLLSVPVRAIRSDRRARMRGGDLRQALRDPGNIHHPRSRLVMLENTHAHRMGMPLERSDVERVASWARASELAIHVDGARLANAAIALDIPMAALLEPVDSGSLCLSKGLACPAGSLLFGSEAFISEARRARKMLGGGQRQIGILAAAGLVALSDGSGGTIGRLADDHRRAAALARGLARLPGVKLDPTDVRTNIVIFELAPRPRGGGRAARRTAFLAALEAAGVRMMPYPRGRIRAATHIDVSDADIERAIGAARSTLA